MRASSRHRHAAVPRDDRASSRALMLTKICWTHRNPTCPETTEGERVAGLSPRAGQVGGRSDCLDLVGLSPLMARTSGSPEIPIGLIDGPVALDQPDLAAENIREVPGKHAGCVRRFRRRGLRARYIYRRDPAGEAHGRGSRDLPRMQPPGSTDLLGGARQRRANAERLRRGARPTPLSTSSMPARASSI